MKNIHLFFVFILFVLILPAFDLAAQQKFFPFRIFISVILL